MSAHTIYRIRTETMTIQTADADAAELHARQGDRVTAVATADP